MTKIMFYSKMKDINNINKLNCNYKIFECYTFVNYYNTENNVIRISNKWHHIAGQVVANSVRVSGI